MSATWLDYDDDGHLDIYAGNMWTAAGQRVTALPGFKPDASPEIREIYRRHARGNSLFRNRGDGTFEDVTLRRGRSSGAGRGRPTPSISTTTAGRTSTSRTACSRAATTSRRSTSTASSGARWWPSRRSTASPGRAYDDGWRATNRMPDEQRGAGASTSGNVLLRNDGHGGFDEVSGIAGLDVDQDGRSFAVFDYDGDGDPTWSCWRPAPRRSFASSGTTSRQATRPSSSA